MTIAVQIFGTVIMLVGLTGLASPDWFRSLFDAMSSETRYVFGIVVRLVMGALLWWVADELRYPQVMRALAIIAVLAAVGILAAGRARLDRLVDWWLARSDGLLRVSATLAAAFGAFLIHVAT